MDGEERMALYFQGKQYRGWKRLREYLQKLEQQRPPRGLREYEERTSRGEGVDRKEMSGIVSSAIPVILPTDTSVENAGRRSLVATVVSMGGGARPYKRQRREEWIALSVVGQTSWIGRTCRNCRAPKPGGNSRYSNSGGGGGGGGGGGSIQQ